MENGSVLVVAALVVAYAAVSGRVRRSLLTAPLVFLVAGLVLGPSGLGWLQSDLGNGLLRLLAEITLTLTLFGDAVRLDLRSLRRSASLPVRMLVVGIPGGVLLGMLVGWAVLPGFGLVAAALLATLLVPTDAALAQPVVTSDVVPLRVRQTVNVESGLNDGLALPVLTVLLAAVAAAEGGRSTGDWVGFVAAQIGWGALVGAAAGAVGGLIVDRGSASGWVDGYFRQIGPMGIAIVAFAGAHAVGGNGFVAAFVAGALFGAVASESSHDATDFSEDEAHLLVLLVLLLFGAEVLAPALGTVTWPIVVYALLSLTVVRMLPIAVSLVGSGVRPVTMLYLGWFGPRGLASIVFVLLVVEELGDAAAARHVEVVAVVVGLSALLHGITARVGSRAYAARLERLREQDPELTAAEDGESPEWSTGRA